MAFFFVSLGGDQGLGCEIGQRPQSLQHQPVQASFEPENLNRTDKRLVVDESHTSQVLHRAANIEMRVSLTRQGRTVKDSRFRIAEDDTQSSSLRWDNLVRLSFLSHRGARRPVAILSIFL